MNITGFKPQEDGNLEITVVVTQQEIPALIGEGLKASMFKGMQFDGLAQQTQELAGQVQAQEEAKKTAPKKRAPRKKAAAKKNV